MDKEYTLVTGASGFIGSHVTEKLLSEERYAVIAIVRNMRDHNRVVRLKEKGAILVEGSFYDNGMLEQIFREFPIRNVVHIAAVRGAGFGTREDYHEVNVHGTEVLLEHSLNNHIRKFIFCSSVGVYGTIPGELPATLNTALKGDNDYHSSKILSERKVQEFIGKGLDAYIVRPTITYGKGDGGFPSTLVKMVRGRMLLLPFRDTKIHLLNVDSLAEVFVRILRTEDIRGRIFIVADESAVSLKELVDSIHIHYKKKKYPSFLRLPNGLFGLAGMFFTFIRKNKWAVRLLLISKSWHYDISNTIDELKFRPADTLECFKTRENEL
jgi:nucleoside-diphosphate-sugar epimerase